MKDIMIIVQRDSTDKVVFWAKEHDKEKVIADLLTRYRNVINKMIKKGKNIEEKKREYRKYIEKNSFYSNDKGYEATLKMTNAILQDLQHSRYYDIECDGSKWTLHNSDNVCEIQINGSSLTITDCSDGWEYISEKNEIETSGKKIKEVLELIKKEDGKKWAILTSIDKTVFVTAKKPIEITVCTYGEKEVELRIDYSEVYFMEKERIKRLLEEEYTILETKIRGNLIKEKAKAKYKNEFGKNW